MAKPISYLGPYNIDRLRPFSTRGTRLGGVDELLAQRSAETINKLGLPTTQREDGIMSGPAVIYDGFRTPQDQANAIRSVARRNRIPWNDSLLRTGIPGMAAPVGRSQHERGRAVDVLEPYVAAFRDNLAPDLRQPLPGSDANHFELVKQAQSVGAAPAGQGDAMAASGNDTMAAIPGATQPTQPYSGMMPEDVNYSRRMGEMLMRQGMSTAPVGHWTQALARVLQGASGGGWMADAQRGGREGQMAGNQALAAALANPSVTPAQYAQTALGNPFIAPQGQQVAQAVITNRMRENDPYRKAQIELAQAKAAQAKAGGAEEYSKNGSVFYDKATGKYLFVQGSNRGKPKVSELTGLQPDRGTAVVGDTIIDKTTGEERRKVTDAIGGAEAAKDWASARVKFSTALPKARAAVRRAKSEVGNVMSTINRALPKIGAGTTGWRGYLGSYVPGTEAYNLVQLINTIESKIVRDTMEEMRQSSAAGATGFGALSERELDLLRSSLQNLKNSQSEEQLRENMLIVRDRLAGLPQRMQQTLDDDIKLYSNRQMPEISVAPDVAPTAAQPDPTQAPGGMGWGAAMPQGRDAIRERYKQYGLD